jgi:hypothetical protein
MNSHFHFLIIVELQTFHMLFQQKGVILQHNNVAPHSTHWTIELLQPFQLELRGHPPYSSGY